MLAPSPLNKEKNPVSLYIRQIVWISLEYFFFSLKISDWILVLTSHKGFVIISEIKPAIPAEAMFVTVEFIEEFYLKTFLKYS
jgi:hypothetical protein